MDAYKFNLLYNTPEAKSMIRKALTSGTGVGEALIPQNLEKVITNTVVRLVPELAVMSPISIAGKTHEFNRMTALPAAGSAMGENSTTPTRNSTFTRASKTLKVLKRKGAVTGFLKASSRAYIDAVSVEMENHLEAIGNDIRTYAVMGNVGADAYSFDGLDTLIATKRTNEAIGGVVPASLKFLDNMIDQNIRKKGNNHRRAILMSPEMLSLVSSLYTNVRDNRDAHREGSKVIQVSGGYRLETYRDVPILETTVTRPTGTMTTVSTATNPAGGTIPDATYFFRVAPVTWDGEQTASAEASQTTAGGNTSTLTLSWTAYTGALYYKIYVGTVSGALNLCWVISAFTYDGDGTISTAVTGKAFTTNPATADTTSVPTHMQSDKPLVATGGITPEVVFLWDLDEYQGLGKLVYTNEEGSQLKGLITVEPLAKTDDNDPFLMKSYPALIDAFEATSALHRGLRVS